MNFTAPNLEPFFRDNVNCLCVILKDPGNNFLCVIGFLGQYRGRRVEVFNFIRHLVESHFISLRPR